MALTTMMTMVMSVTMGSNADDFDNDGERVSDPKSLELHHIVDAGVCGAIARHVNINTAISFMIKVPQLQ